MVEAHTSSSPSGPRRGTKSAAAFRTISEVADDLDVPPHVLRFWETKFNQVRPLKRGGGRRYYRPEDIALLRRIRELLYREGYTIKGVQKLLRDGAARMPTAGETARAQSASGGNDSGGSEFDGAASNGVNANGNGTASADEAGRAERETTAAAGVSVMSGTVDGVDRQAVEAVLNELQALKRLLTDARSSDT